MELAFIILITFPSSVRGGVTDTWMHATCNYIFYKGENIQQFEQSVELMSMYEDREEEREREREEERESSYLLFVISLFLTEGPF